MLDLDRPLTVTWNGRRVHRATVERSLDTLLDDFLERRDAGQTVTASLTLKRPR
ncbi:MAG: hypothetical protein ACYS22_13750 [Planctomycetota bacterium]|jgi:hypothetical protein